VIIATAARLNLWAAWTRMGAEHPSTPPLPKDERIDRHEPIALQQTGHEVPCCGRRGAHLARPGLGEVSATAAFVRAQTMSKRRRHGASDVG
jgi:hypothetical protein